MITLTTDELRLLNDLRNVAAPERVYAPSGEFLGLFLPAGKGAPSGRLADDDLKRRMNEKPVGSFSDMVKRLKVMTEESNRRRSAGERDFTLDEATAFLKGNNRQPPEAE